MISGATGVKHYEIFGPLFFGSVSAFNEEFDVLNNPNEIVIDFKENKVVDMGGIEAVNKLTERYKKLDKKLQLELLSEDCRKLLSNAEKIIDVNFMEDPSYRVAIDKL
jgi:SulP family sulfate permease